MCFIDVSVVVPILNEEKYIKNCLDSILLQNFPNDRLEIILVDGNSWDGTVEIIEPYIKKYEFIKLFQNPKKTVQHALNIGIQNAAGKYIVRMDAHAFYEPDYISKCVEYLEKTGADNVGGPTRVKGKTKIQKIIASSYSSPFALGGSKHYSETFEGYADTVSWGAFKRQTLIDVGLYDPQLPRSEDDDLNFRIIKNGGKIFITPQIKSIYYPKDSFVALFKQYFNYGLWKVAVTKKHRRPLRVLHLIPMLFVAFLVLFGALSFVSKFFAAVFFAVVCLYLALSIFFAFKNENAKSVTDKLGLVWTHFVLHSAYGLGFWMGIFKFWNTDFNQ